MLGRGFLVLGIMLWAGVSTAVMLRASKEKDKSPERLLGKDAPAQTTPDSSTAASATSIMGLPFRSVTMQLQRADWLDRYEHSIDEIAALGADTVMFVVDPRQEHGESNRIYLDLRMTPTPEALQRLVKHAKSKNLRVILMPIVLLDAPRKDTEWRGTIKPENWSEWWTSYTALMVHFSWIAEGSGVDLLVVGSELVSTEKQPEEWRKLIAKIRGIYKGKLTYSSNWDHYTAVTFWDALDLIGMNSYWSLDEGKKAEASVSDINSAWKDIQSDLLPFAKKQGKPIMFLEAGWCSIANAAHEPWDYTRVDYPVDMDLQKRLYEGFFQSWYGHPQLGGFSIWEWPVSSDPADKGYDDDVQATKRGYTPEGKPAEKVLRHYLSQGGWAVNPTGNRSSNRPNTNGPAR